MMKCFLAVIAIMAMATGIASAAEVPAGKVLATIGASKITVGDYRYEVSTLPGDLKEMAAMPEGKQEMLDTMIIREAILIEAKKLGLDKAFAKESKDLKKRLTVEAYLKDNVKPVKVSDQDTLRFYNENKANYTADLALKVSDILVEKEEDARWIIEQLKSGADFAALAKEYSNEDTADKGGDIGYISNSDQPFEQAAFALADGQISPPVKGEHGYYVIKVTGRRENYLYSFAEVKDNVKKTIEEQKQNEAFQKLKVNLRAKFKIKIDQAVFAEL